MWLRLSSNFKGDSLQNHSYWTIPRADHGDRFVGCEIVKLALLLFGTHNSWGEEENVHPFLQGPGFHLWVGFRLYVQRRATGSMLITIYLGVAAETGYTDLVVVSLH